MDDQTTSEHTPWMRRALEEAEKGIGLTSPNPCVGSVVVKDGVELGAGWHHRAGQPHAEREALADVLAKHGPEAARGATIYVTLEPCSTTGKTPPCTQGIIDAGITRVVYGAVDPNPDHAGAADLLLQGLGIDVISGIEREACESILRPFAKRVTTGLPWVLAKTAMSLDGRITRPPGEGQWLTGPAARNEVQKIRGEADAIIVGGRTVRIDNPRLTIRGPHFREEKEQPWRVVITQDGKQTLPEDCHLLSDEYAHRTVVYQDKEPEEILRDLAAQGCNCVMLECGGRLMRRFAELDLIDEYAIFYAPIITGGEDFGFGAGGHLPASRQLEEISVKQLEQDVLIRGIAKRKIR
ncbi:bifunctional diaminohydroxyphosphoribosylaminopyrimidine deaminase/5-amino-6-(5-phosphoribosylamino)uracil reductase RibD [Rubritalea squalenifaciens]|nr:bifunctional diaminohydroxyphosphoribosylaminopyrimidine deaminase/5-amino-6-(5-phosphoribosylamino)uracil reductase RibD [Rubritalea squalenifaciens]